MEAWLLFAIILVVVSGAPFLVFIWGLVAHLNEYPLSTTLSLTFASLCVGTWVVAGVPLIIFTPEISNEFRGHCVHGGLISVVIAELLFATVFAGIGIGKNTIRLAQITALALTAHLTVLLISLVEGGLEPTRVVGDTEFVRPYHTGVTMLFSAVAHLMFAGLLFSFYWDYRRMPESVLTAEELRHNRRALILLAVGTAISTINAGLASIVSSPPKYVFAIVFFIARFQVSIGFFLLVLHLTRCPFVLINKRGNTRRLLEAGTVGWSLASMRDDGPTPVSQNTPFNERNSITKIDMLTFCTASMTAVGMGESFRDASFLLPFPYHKDLVAVCVSFFHRDPDVNDVRLEDRALCVFAIIVPTVLLRCLKAIEKTPKTVDQFKKRAPTVAVLAHPKMVAELAQAVLDTII